MNEYIKQFGRNYDYPQEAVQSIIGAYDTLKNNLRFAEMLNNYYTDKTITKEVFLKDIRKISEDEKINYFTVCLTFFVCLTPKLKEEYKKADIPDDVSHDTIEDLKYKLFECHKVQGVWGLEPTEWFYMLFHLKFLAFGRLQFNTNPFRWEYAEVAGISITKGEELIYMHIPSSGRPFDKESRLDAYDRAYKFFKQRYFPDKEPIFCCDTWLLFPENRDMLDERSNIVSFMDDFKIFHSYTYRNFENPNLWRVFGSDAKRPPEELPRKSSIQKAYAEHLAKGNELGNGVGIFVYDPVNKETVK